MTTGTAHMLKVAKGQDTLQYIRLWVFVHDILSWELP